MPEKLAEFRLQGIPELVATLEALTPFLRRKYVLKAMKKGGEVVQRKIVQVGVVPVLAAPIYRNGKLIRKPGTIRDSIKVRTSKDASKQGDVGVFVNPVPAKGEDRGKYSPNDNFYWRFVNFGTKRMKARRYLQIGAQELTGPALTAIEQSLAPDMKQLNLPGVVK